MPYHRTVSSGRLAILLIFQVSRGGYRCNESFDGGFDVGSSGPSMKSFAHPEFSQFVKLSRRVDQNWAIGATKAQKIVVLPHPTIIPDLILRRRAGTVPVRLPERRPLWGSGVSRAGTPQWTGQKPGRLERLYLLPTISKSSASGFAPQRQGSPT